MLTIYNKIIPLSFQEKRYIHRNTYIASNTCHILFLSPTCRFWGHIEGLQLTSYVVKYRKLVIVVSKLWRPLYWWLYIVIIVCIVIGRILRWVFTCVYIYVHISLHASFFMHSIDQSIHCMEGPQGQSSRMCGTGRLSFHVSYLDNVNLSQLSLHMSVCLPCTQLSISLSTHSLKSGLNVHWICSSKRLHVMCIPYWFIDCETHKMASCAWFVEETGASLTYGETTVCNDSW